ncbi:hypothetical protein DFQ26_001305 [Actinomortierella ambigua]|nr:hypothetical protein DFQ26_001305 [Actinomortierella ambigua]
MPRILCPLSTSRLPFYRHCLIATRRNEDLLTHVVRAGSTQASYATSHKDGSKDNKDKTPHSRIVFQRKRKMGVSRWQAFLLGDESLQPLQDVTPQGLDKDAEKTMSFKQIILSPQTALAVFLPKGYPHSVTSNYWPFAKWQFYHNVAGSVSSVISTQALLFAMGLGAGSIPMAAALNWIIKDGLGQLGGVVYASFVSDKFDSEPKRFRFQATVAMQGANILELLSPLWPGSFLFIASVSNIGTGLGVIIAAIMSRASSDPAVLPLIPMCLTFLPFSIFNIYSNYRSSQFVTTPSFNIPRTETIFYALLRDLMATNALHAPPTVVYEVQDLEKHILSPEDIAEDEVFVRKYKSTFRVKVHIEPDLETFAREYGTAALDRALAQQGLERRNGREKYYMAITGLSTKRPTVTIWFDRQAKTADILRGFYHACTTRLMIEREVDEESSNTTGLAGERETAVVHRAHEHVRRAMPSVMAALVRRGWDTESHFLTDGDQHHIHISRHASANNGNYFNPGGIDFDLPPAHPPHHQIHITTIEEEDESEYIQISSHDTSTPVRSVTASPALSFDPSASPDATALSDPPTPQQQPTRYPRTRHSLNSNTPLPLYSSRTQRMRNGSSSSVDQTGKPVYRGFGPRTTSDGVVDDDLHGTTSAAAAAGVGGSTVRYHRSYNNNSDSDDDAEGYFVGNHHVRSGHHRYPGFRSRRGLPWYKHRETQIVGSILVMSLIVRLWKIGYPTSVVFDEVHFGGFASKYLKGRFFMDVHPPLAKMLIALVGWLAGLDSQFTFAEIGMDYIEPKVPYIAMRLLGGLMGVAVVPMAYYTVRNSGHSIHASILAAVLVLFAFTALAWTNFYAERMRPFSDDWFIWLCLTGFGLGLSGSVKWVGLFIIATIGTSTIYQLWLLWGDLKVPVRTWVHHFLARAVFLIALPIVVYMFMFEIHFLILRSSGDGDGFMSAPFQMTLGYSLNDSPLRVAYGATVNIRHLGSQGGYLHSHTSNYETGSKQQQITLYPHKDQNNDWVIQKADGTLSESLEYIKHGDIIRLSHVSTHKRLHSHDNKAPVTDTENHFEVSGYGHEGFEGDSNDNWRVEIVDYEGRNAEAGKELHTLRSRFKLVHINMSCDLFSHKVKLPKWAFEQQEVTCMRSAAPAMTTWMIESNAYANYPKDAEMVNYKKPGFFGKFFELNKVMWKTNQGLTESHPYDSRPSSWIWLRRGISFWGKENRHIYLVGNWFTWYAASVSVVLYVLIRLLLVLRDKRGYRDNFRGLREYYELSGGFFFMAWAYHYLPFFLMGRQLFLHHYLPALYFGILLFCVTFDLACRFIPNRHRVIALVLISSIAIYVFRARAPLVYGSNWTRNDCLASKLLDTWDYDCTQYPETYDFYQSQSAPGTVVPDPMVGRIIDPPGSVNNSDGNSSSDGASSVSAEDSVPMAEDAKVAVQEGLTSLTERIGKQLEAEKEKKAEEGHGNQQQQPPPPPPAKPVPQPPGQVAAQEGQPPSPHPRDGPSKQSQSEVTAEAERNSEEDDSEGEEVDGGYDAEKEPVAAAVEPKED